MADYSLDINTSLYKYRQPIYITEPTGERQTYVPLKLNLNDSNFNFDLSRSDGADLRLAERSNGTGVLEMWVAYWSAADRKATVWFKLPELLASETRTLYAYWGYEYDAGISDLDTMVSGGAFDFGDDFDAPILDVNKWPTSLGSWTIANSAINLGTDAWIRSINILGGQNTVYTDEWVLTPTAGLWGARQAAGTCYLGTSRLYTGADELIDGVVDVENVNPYIYVSGLGCSLGIDLGIIVDKISKVRIYLYNIPENTANNSLITGSWAYLSKSDTNDADSYELIYSYVYQEMVLVQVSPYVWYFDLHFDVPGQSFRYVMFQAGFTFDTPMTYDITEIKVYARDSATTTEPGNFLVEEGIVGIGSPSSTTEEAHRYRFYGGENTLGINYYWDGSTDRKHDFVYAETYSTYNGTNKGLEIGSYSQNYIAYYEPTDRVYQGMANRDNYSDYDDSWERKVNRNTEVSNFRIYGEDGSSANGVSIDWVVVRDFTPDSDPIIDLTDLWLDYEYVGHQLLDYIEYTSDVTSVDFHHLSDMAGDPYRMSDNITNSISNVFISDGTTTSGSLIIDFGRGRYSITDAEYTHFNSDNSVYYYNASKLSDLDTDVHDRDYWQTTTTSGWAAIEFTDTKDISCLALRAVSGITDGMPDNFRFYGSQSNPRFGGWSDKVLIYEGQARSMEEEQTFYFSTGLTFYKYYILEVLDTHGSNVAIQEWGMYERSNIIGKKVISQLRLHPAAFTDNEYYFVKEIEFYGSDDGFTWVPLIAKTDTPTPFTDYTYGRWSRYSFENFEAYYIYKMTCYNNWHADEDIIKMAEWEMVVKADEIYNHRILSGTTNNINNIWADPGTTMSSGIIYVTNEEFNSILNDKLLHHSELPLDTGDFNVKT